jgi:hypothetical protein
VSIGSAQEISYVDVETLLAWAKVILSGALTIILIPLVVYFVKYWWERRRWQTFERLIRAWAREEISPENFTEQEWNALTAMKLSEAGYEPTRIKELMELAVWFGKGLASQELRGRSGFEQEENGNGESSHPKGAFHCCRSEAEFGSGRMCRSMETSPACFSSELYRRRSGACSREFHRRLRDPMFHRGSDLFPVVFGRPWPVARSQIAELEFAHTEDQPTCGTATETAASISVNPGRSAAWDTLDCTGGGAQREADASIILTRPSFVSALLR